MGPHEATQRIRQWPRKSSASWLPIQLRQSKLIRRVQEGEAPAEPLALFRPLRLAGRLALPFNLGDKSSRPKLLRVIAAGNQLANAGGYVRFVLLVRDAEPR